MNIKEKIELGGHLDTILELIEDILDINDSEAYYEKLLRQKGKIDYNFGDIVAEKDVKIKCDNIRNEISEMLSFIVNSK